MVVKVQRKRNRAHSHAKHILLCHIVEVVHMLKGNGTLIVSVGGFIYVYKRLVLQSLLLNAFISCFSY